MNALTAPLDTVYQAVLHATALNLKRQRDTLTRGKDQACFSQALGLTNFLSSRYFHELQFDDLGFTQRDRNKSFFSSDQNLTDMWPTFANLGSITKGNILTYGIDGCPSELRSLEGYAYGVEMTSNVPLGRGVKALCICERVTKWMQ